MVVSIVTNLQITRMHKMPQKYTMIQAIIVASSALINMIQIQLRIRMADMAVSILPRVLITLIQKTRAICVFMVNR